MLVMARMDVAWVGMFVLGIFTLTFIFLLLFLPLRCCAGFLEFAPICASYNKNIAESSLSAIIKAFDSNGDANMLNHHCRLLTKHWIPILAGYWRC